MGRPAGTLVSDGEVNDLVINVAINVAINVCVTQLLMQFNAVISTLITTGLGISPSPYLRRHTWC